jgi:hypothetical protein
VDVHNGPGARAHKRPAATSAEQGQQLHGASPPAHGCGVRMSSEKNMPGKQHRIPQITPTQRANKRHRSLRSAQNHVRLHSLRVARPVRSTARLPHSRLLQRANDCCTRVYTPHLECGSTRNKGALTLAAGVGGHGLGTREHLPSLQVSGGAGGGLDQRSIRVCPMSPHGYVRT